MVNDAGGGGGGTSGTYWYGIDVQVMWDWVNRDLSAHYDQASSWKKTSELAGLYGQRLQAFRDRLAQTWKPETSKASEAFLTKLDELIVSVKNIDTVAGANYQASVDIPNAMSEAKYKLQPIYNEWKASKTPEDATITANRAAGVMYSLSSDLSSSRTSLGPPAPYKAPGQHKSRDSGGDQGGGGGGGDSSMGAPPVIPPVVPAPAPPPPPPPSGEFKPFPQPKAPELVQVGPLTPTPPTPTPTPPPSTTPPGTGPVPPGPGVIKPPPGTGPVPPAPAGRPGMPPITTPPAGGVPPRGTTGLIGGAQPPGGAGRGPAGARPNPVGGMIGGPGGGGGRGGVPGAGGAVAGGVAGRGGVAGVAGGPGMAGRGGAGGAAGGAGRGAMGVMGAGGRPGQQHDEEGEHFDPDTQWDVAQGVAPVLDTPERQDDIDPGPAIGLAR